MEDRIAHEGRRPFNVLVYISQLLEHDLNFLAIGRVHGDETDAFAILHLRRRSVFEKMRHCGQSEVTNSCNWEFGLNLSRQLGKTICWPKHEGMEKRGRVDAFEVLHLWD